MILAIDTSGSHLAIAIANDSGNVIQEFHAEAVASERGIHDARLAQEVQSLLDTVRAKATDITRVGLIIGPGSFTGLRIGLSFAKGLAYAVNAGLVALTQHEVMAHYAKEEWVVTPGYREDLFYIAQLRDSSEIRLIHKDELPMTYSSDQITMSELCKLTAESKRDIRDLELDTLEPLYITEFKIS